jgi:hypothetical protein
MLKVRPISTKKNPPVVYLQWEVIFQTGKSGQGYKAQMLKRRTLIRDMKTRYGIMLWPNCLITIK